MVLLATPDSVGTDHLRQKRNQERQYIFDTVGPHSAVIKEGLNMD